MRLVGPRREEHGALQDERIRVGRPAETVEQTLHSVAGQHELEVFAALPCQTGQPGADGRREVLDGPLRQRAPPDMAA